MDDRNETTFSDSRASGKDGADDGGSGPGGGDTPGDGGQTDSQTGTQTIARDDVRERHMPMYHVVLLDDDDHTYEYVIEMLAAIFGHPEAKGYQMACEVDATGRVICATLPLEHAEVKRDQIHAYGYDYRIAACQGSMSAIIEAAAD